MGYEYSLNFPTKVRGLLLAAEARGISQHALWQKVRPGKGHKTQELLDLLDAWEARDWVQKFIVRTESCRPKTVWRATVLLEKEWPEAVRAATRAVTEGSPSLSLGSAQPSRPTAAEPDRPSWGRGY